MPRSFLVKKWVKGEEAGYHSYRVRRNDYHDDVIDISLKAMTPYTPYTPLALPAAVAPLTVRVNNGYIHDIIPSPLTHNAGVGGGNVEDVGVEAVVGRAAGGQEEGERPREEGGEEASSPHPHTPHLLSESAATSPSLPPVHFHQEEGESVDSEGKGPGHIFTNGVTVGYTFDAFFISDGRSKRRHSLESGSGSDSEAVTQLVSGVAGSPEKGAHRQRYTCSECGKDYATSSNLSRHKQTHRSLDSKNAKKCPHCDKLYVSMPALSMHVLTHDLKHTCNVCGKHFSRPWLLQGHMRSHTGEKPYGCAHCGKAFADRSNLRAHMQTHSAFKHYTCGRCNKSFALKSYLNKHYESACIKE